MVMLLQFVFVHEKVMIMRKYNTETWETSEVSAMNLIIFHFVRLHELIKGCFVIYITLRLCFYY